MREPSDVDETFGETLREARERRGFSQSALADEMQRLGFEFQQQTIYKIESGNRKVTIGEAAAFARALALPSVTTLLNGKNSLSVSLLLRPVLASYDEIFFASQRMIKAQIDLAVHLTKINDEDDLPEQQVDDLRDALRYNPTDAADDARAFAMKLLSEEKEISSQIRQIIVDAWRKPASDG